MKIKKKKKKYKTHVKLCSLQKNANPYPNMFPKFGFELHNPYIFF